MSRALVFVNLAVDQLWDQAQVLKNIFPAKIPSSIRLVRANEDLGVFLGNFGDICLGYSRIPTGLMDLWQHYGFSPPELVGLKCNPYDVPSWLAEFSKVCQRHTSSFTHLIAAGISPLEMGILQINAELGKSIGVKLHLTTNCSQLGSNLYQKLNNKLYLFDWCKKNNTPFPPSRDIKFAEISDNDDSPDFVLKAEFGSGGGGNLRGGFLRGLVKRHPELGESRWLLQKYLNRKSDYTCFGWINANGEVSEPCTYEVQYDQYSLSNFHRTHEAGFLQGTYSQLANHLKSKSYFGPFGFDSILTDDDVLYPITDLNVRLTKTHLLYAAAEKFKVHKKPHRFIRLRIAQLPVVDLSQTLEKLFKLLKLDRFGQNASSLIIPIQWGSLIQREPNEESIGPGEITFLVAGESDKDCDELLVNLQQLVIEDLL